MSTFAVKIRTVASIKDHPNADRLSVAQVEGYECIVGRDQFTPGEPIIYVPEGAVVPAWILKKYGFWDQKLDRGMLDGTNGDRCKPRRLRGIYSQGLVLPLLSGEDPPMSDERVGRTWIGFEVPNDDATYVFDGGVELIELEPGEEVAHLLGITKYEPEIPEELLGSVFDLFDHTQSYDFESIQTLTDLFAPGEEVEATEKIHGFNTQIGYIPGLNHEHCFGESKSVYIASKGLASKGLAFTRLDENGEPSSNIYVDFLNRVLHVLEQSLVNYSESVKGMNVRLFCEIYGGQDLKYGANKGETGAALFGVYIGDKPTGEWVPYEMLELIAPTVGMKAVPLLYKGPFDLDKLREVRDGKDTFTDTHIREGIVITGANPNATHEMHGRKIGKWVSPDYGSRKGGTEFQ
jgi:RNA ligase (TIGR02306 family)